MCKPARARPRTVPVVAWLGGIALASLPACTNAGKAEAESLSTAIERYRTADNALKGSMAEALDKTPCTVTDVCETKRLCVAVSDPTARGLALKNEVERGLASVHTGKLAPDAPEARALPDKLDEAARLLERGHAALSECDDKLRAMKRHYGI
ncbi:hypothetical protein [Pendulispora albinea]|uniref:Secreted protein n=1 Tax=Pendulispora albinea TaxID=2741071 RepID=A0ABZ2LN13_9BACT